MKGGILGFGLSLWQRIKGVSTPTPIPYSLQFDGINDFISVPNVASLQVTGDQSWSIWCKLENLTSLQFIISQRDTNTSRVKFTVLKRTSNDGIADYRNQIQYYISADGSTTNVKSYISKGQTTTGWCLVGWTFSANSLKPYFNNAELTTGAGTLTKVTDATVNALYNNTTDEIKFGAVNTSPGFFAKGFLDYGLFCNKALSGAEWSELYSMKPGSLPEPSGFSFSTNIVSLWEIGEDPDIYNGTGGILDSVGTNHGTMTNFSVGGSFSTDVARDSSLYFDGVNDYVDLSTHIASLDFNAPATISAWVKLVGSHKTTGGSIFTLSNFGATANFTVGFGSASGAWTNEVLSVRYLNDAGSVNNGVAFVDATDSYAGNWYHIVATCSGSAWKLYMNAVDKTLTNFTSNTGKYGDGITATKASIGILMRSSGNIIPFPGFIDQFSIWNKVLSAAEVSELYALKPSSIPDYSTLSFWANRVIWNPIGETGDTWGTSGGILDYSGNNYHGTMNNFSVGGSFSTDVAT